MTTAATGRVRRSVRFAQMQAGTESAVREGKPRRERMSVSGRLEMSSFPLSQDWTGGMGTSPSGRFQVVEHTQPGKKPVSREGIRTDWARALIWIIAALLCTVLLAETAAMGTSALHVRKLQARIEAAENRNGELKSSLSVSSGDISVCTRAVELNLISSAGAPTIQLTAPENATMTLVETAEAGTTAEPEMRASAGTDH